MASGRHHGPVIIQMMHWDGGLTTSVVTWVQAFWMAFTFAATLARGVASDMLNMRAYAVAQAGEVTM